MAAFYVFTGLREAGLGGFPGGKREYTKAEAEALTGDKRFSAGVIKVLGPIQEARLVEIDAANAAEAARFARVVLGLQVTGTALVAASRITEAEAGEKPSKTVAEASLANTSAL